MHPIKHLCHYHWVKLFLPELLSTGDCCCTVPSQGASIGSTLGNPPVLHPERNLRSQFLLFTTISRSAKSKAILDHDSPYFPCQEETQLSEREKMIQIFVNDVTIICYTPLPLSSGLLGYLQKSSIF